jgi:hypothetical protein
MLFQTGLQTINSSHCRPIVVLMILGEGNDKTIHIIG